MTTVWTVARRELKAFFDQPTGYIILIVFVGFNNFLFFQQAYLFGVASLRPMFEFLPWMLLFFVPAVTMRALAEDYRSGTVEVVLAQPLTELTFLLGKYAGQVLLIWVGLALTLLIPLGLSLGADLHAGVIVAQYFGAALLAAGLAAIGVWASSLTRNQITAFIVAVTVMFLFVLIGLDPLLVGLPPALSTVAARLGVLSHFRDIARGVIDLRDVVYFATLAAAFLGFAYVSVMARKLSTQGEALRRLRLGMTVVVVGLVVVNLFGRNIGGRLDLTPGRAYTLSDATKALVREADDLITFRLFASKELPQQVALLRRDIDDLLRDYRAAGGDNVRVTEMDPSDDPEAEAEARRLGIPPVQFNVMGEGEVTFREGFLGLAVQYADQSETIPLVQRTDDLEYRLSSLIHGMTDTSKTTVAFYVDPSEQQLGTSYQTFRDQLGGTLDVVPLVITGDTIFADNVSVAVLIGTPDSLSAAQRAQFDAFLDRGGSLFVAASGMNIGQQAFAMGRPVAWNAVLNRFGVAIESDMAYDLLSHERVQMPTQFGISILQSYPLWIRALSTQANVVNQELESVFFPWPSTVDTTAALAGTVTPLFVTSEAGGVQADAVMLEPRREFPEDSLASRLLAAAVNPLAVDEPTSAVAGRAVVVGNTQFLSDRLGRNNPANTAFALNALDWLAQDDALIAIRAKNRNPPPLLFSSEGLSNFVKWLNVIGVPLLVAVAAIVRLVKRRQRTRLRYEPVAVGGAA